MKLTLLDRVLALAADSIPVALATDLASGRQQLVTATDRQGDLELGPVDLAAIRARLANDGESGMVELSTGAIFVETWSPPQRLVIVGAVHIAQALAPLARALSYKVTIVDPRGAFATQERFGAIEIIHDWPDDAIPALAPDRRTAIVVLSHDPKIDDPALIAALQSDAFYIGALGSRRSHASRRERLLAAGLSADAIDRIHGPVGLAIGAQSPAEIAISILAEITACLRGGALAGRSGWHGDDKGK
jgi:xanthine dehydrogenase accessory factor